MAIWLENNNHFYTIISGTKFCPKDLNNHQSLRWMQSHQDDAKRVSEMSGWANNPVASQHSSIPAEDWVAPIYTPPRGLSDWFIHSKFWLNLGFWLAKTEDIWLANYWEHFNPTSKIITSVWCRLPEYIQLSPLATAFPISRNIPCNMQWWTFWTVASKDDLTLMFFIVRQKV